MPDNSEPRDELENDIRLPDVSDDPGDPGFERVLLRIMQTDPDSNLVFGNIPKGEAEDRAAALAYALHTGSTVILDYENFLNMAKRAESGGLLEKILGTLKAIGKATGGDRQGFFSRLRGS